MKKPSEADGYSEWKAIVPVLYDWLANHHLMWPSLSCRWGPQLEQGTYRNRQRLYTAEQTDGSMPNTLVVANCEIVKPRIALANHISEFKADAKSAFVKKLKTIIHPGEVNRIRELPQNPKIVATHTDSPEVYVWNTETQPNRTSGVGAQYSQPDLVLTGHVENSEFALACSPVQPLVLSGGKDRNVLLWGISDYISKACPGPGRQRVRAGSGSRVEARGVFKGHSDTVEDVQFRPSSSDEFCSVGDDSCLILWDARAGNEPAIKVEKAHLEDIHCVDWNAKDENLLLTGSADSSISLFDLRSLSTSGPSAPIRSFQGHTGAVLCVQWCPAKASVFGSCAEDGVMNVWDYERRQSKHAASGVFFQHAGHRGHVVDFHWDPVDAWTVASVSHNGHTPGGGGTLQLWRMSDFIYRSDEEVLEELERLAPHILSEIMVGKPMDR